jgi:hypothetical protein
MIQEIIWLPINYLNIKMVNLRSFSSNQVVSALPARTMHQYLDWAV